MEVKLRLAPVFFTIFFLLLLAKIVFAQSWQTLEQGLHHKKIQDVHIFRIDPKKFKFSVATARDIGETNTIVKRLAKEWDAILGINGGFFSPEQKSLGLIMRNGILLNPLHHTSWWGVFYVQDQKPRIVSSTHFKKNPQIEMALQVGPRLVVDGKIPKLKYSIAKRSGIGIRKDGEVFIAITEENAMALQTFAELFAKPEKEGGLECIDAINLDGGGSSQLHLHAKAMKLDIPGTSRITNAIMVMPR